MIACKKNEQIPVKLKVNGKWSQIRVNPQEILLDTIRARFDLTGVKRGCDTGECGACTILIDGKAVNSCLFLTVDTDGKSILTIEGVSTEKELHPLQKAFIRHGAIQCGYCTSGMILSAKALLDKNPYPTINEIKEGISGNLCRCTGYVKIIESVSSVVKKRNG